MSETKISVIIPTCHRNDLLAKCLDCLAPGVQSLPVDQYEVIVTDDGSKSTAEQMVRENYSWAQWVAGPRKGPAANRNNGTKFAKGEWLAFTDDDCLPSPQWLEAYVNAIIPDVYVYEGKTTCEGGIHSPLEDAPINLEGGVLWSCNMMISNLLFQEVEGFDESFPHPHMEDADLRERLKATGKIFPFINHAVIDHPPKRKPCGRKIAMFHESEVYFWYKSGHRRPLKVGPRLWYTFKYRLKLILRLPHCKDSLLALYSMFEELWYLALKFKSWNNKHCNMTHKSI